MLKHLKCSVEQVDALLSQLLKNQKDFTIELRKNPNDQSLRSKIEEAKTMGKAYQQIVNVRQKVEELTNYLQNQSPTEIVTLQIEVYECQEIYDDYVPGQDSSSQSTIGKQCIDQMKYSSPMPECFEKSLVRICYLLERFKLNLATGGLYVPESNKGILQKKENDHQKESDRIIEIMTQDEVLSKLDIDLTNLINQYEVGKIEDSSIEIPMTQSVKNLKGVKLEEKLVDQQQISLINILSKVRPFNFQEFFELVKVCDKNSEEIRGKDIILLLGTTGAGKSTTIQYLCGGAMKKYEDGHIQAYPMDKKLKSFVASAAMKSETRYINPIDFEFQKSQEKSIKLTIVDTPGFGDTQSIEVDIANSLGIIRAVSKAKSVYPVFLFNQKNTGQKWELMKQLIDFYSCMIKNLDANLNSINFFFSHFADLNQDMGKLMEKVNKELNALELSKLSLKSVLERMEVLGKQKKLLILDPLDKNKRVMVLDQILSTKPIINPKKAFTLNVLERSRAYLEKQISLHEKSIIEAVSQGNTEQAAFKIQEIKDLAAIFEPYDLQYKSRFQQINQAIKSQVSLKIGIVQERICTCMKPGNQLYESDIKKFKDALIFEKKLSPLIPSPQIQSDQEEMKTVSETQSTMITEIISHCSNVLNDIDRDYKICDDEWPLFIKKAISLSLQIDGFMHLQKNALDKFNVKFYNLSNSAKEIIKTTSINDYQPQELDGGPESSGEEIKQKQNHQKLGQILFVLFQALKKVKQIPVSEINSFTSNLEKFIEEILQKIPKLTKSIQENFQFDQNEDGLNYKVLSEDKLKKIKMCLDMLERFMSACKNIDNRFYQAFESIFKENIQKCEELFEAHQKFFEDLQKNLDVKSSAEVNSRFRQIDLLRQIPQIMHKTNGPYHSILSQLKNSVSFSKTEVLSIIEELNYFTEQQQGNMQGLNLLFKRLKEALISIKTLGEATTENQEFMKKMYNNIKDSLESLVKRLGQEGNLYINLSPRNYQNIRPLANIYEQIIKIEELSAIIKAEIKADFVDNWLQSIKSTVILIQSDCDKFSIKLMDKVEYRSLDNYFKFMNELCQVQNSSAAIVLVRNKINQQFLNEQTQIDENFMENIYKVIKEQFKFKKEQFNLAFKEFCKQTQSQNDELNEEEKTDLGVVKSYSTIEEKIKDEADIILKLFKLENDIKHYYDQIYYKNSFGMIDLNENYFLTKFTKTIKSEFLEDLQRPADFIEKPMKWKYLKLQGLKYLKDIDSYIIEGNGQLIKQVYDTLYDQVHFNPPEYLNNAQNDFNQGDFKTIKERCQNLQASPKTGSSNSLNILNKIKNYLSDQGSKKFQLIQKSMPYDKNLEIEQAKQIAKICLELIDIKTYLNDYISIHGKTISQQIQEIFNQIAECFQQILENIEKNHVQNLFFQSFTLINKSKELMKVFTSELNSQMQNDKDFKLNFDTIDKIYQSIKEKQDEITASIQLKLENFMKNDEMKFDYKFSPRSLCENLNKIENNEIIAKYIQDFNSFLIEKYKELKRKFKQELETALDIETIYDIENNLQKYRETISNAPNEIQTDLKELLSGFTESYKIQFQEKQQRAFKDFQQSIAQSKSFGDLQKLLEKKYKLIQIDSSGQLKELTEKKVQAQYNQILNQADSNIKTFQLQEAIQEVQKLSDSVQFPNVQDYLTSEQKQGFYKLMQSIPSMFKQSIIKYSQYFSETHSEKGERILNEEFQENQESRNINFKIIQGILSSLNNQKDFILQDCIPDIETILNQFFINSSQYLRNMKAQHKMSLQNKEPEENIAVISNMKFTNQVLTNEFIATITIIKDVICTLNCQQFLQEVKNSSLENMQNITYDWLMKDSKELHNQPFINSVLGEQERIKYYKELQIFFEIISKARATEELSIIKDHGQTKIQRINEYYQKFCFENIQQAVQKVSIFIDKINKNDQMDKNEQQQFGSLYKSLKSMLLTLQIERNNIEKVIDDIEGALKSKLAQLQKDAKICYILGEEKLNLRQLAIILCEIQSMNENLVLFQDQINKTIDQILEDYSKSSPKVAIAAVQLQSQLRNIGSQGPMLASNHPFFRGLNILEANKKFQSKKIGDVLKYIEGTELNEDDKEDLKTFYEEFLGIYTTIIDEMLGVDSSGNKQEIEFSGIIATIKNACSSQSAKRWTEEDLFDEIEWGLNREKKKKITLLLANIFALWTLMNSQDYKKQQELDSSQTNLKGYLLQPHVAQILSILRIMGFGYSDYYSGGSKFNKEWAEVFGKELSDTSCIRNNLVQIKTGEGKSIVLAVVSIIFALNGFDVDCACYSKYLSVRDNESFLPLFRILGIDQSIYYGTFNEIAERKLNQNGNIRDIIQSLVLKKQFCDNKLDLQLNKKRRPQVLLIDEVDVFFSKNFYGNIYIPQALIKHEYIRKLTDYIWKRRQQNIEQSKKVQDQNIQISPYLSLKDIKNQKEYSNVLNLFKPEFQFLVEEAVKKMIIDVVEYESPDHHYVLHDGQIGYENQDQISTNAIIGYQTLFAYYSKNQKGEIKDEIIYQKKAIGINCSSLSYAEVPLSYNIILGVTGTLQTLSEPQKNIINEVYQIHHQTFAPSVYSSDDFSIFNPNTGVIIVQDSSEYYMKLINEIAIYLDSSRPVILFFEDNKSIKQFQNSENFIDKNLSYQIINEMDSDLEKKIKVLRATQEGTVTLSTKNFGRGTDFCCYDQKVIQAGGLVVIQTFLSQDLSEETQIRGRTGRQGTKGTYQMFLNLQDLSKFNIESIHIQNSKNVYKTLCEFRDTKLANEQKETTQNRDNLKIQHDQSINIMNISKKIIMKDFDKQIYQEPQSDGDEENWEEFKQEDIQQTDLEKVQNYLLEMNKGITLESNQKIMKVLVLIDATGSMGLTLQKTKNCVSAMFYEARKALKAMDVNEDLILMKIGGYRNYNSPFSEIFQVSQEWTSDHNSIAKFLLNLDTRGGWGNEALEVGLQYANNEIQNDQGIPLSMVIIIGDAPPNTISEVETKRKDIALRNYNNNKKYWEQSQNYKKSTYWEHELRRIKEANIPVHSFYVLNEHMLGKDAENNKAYLKSQFSKLAVNEGKCSFIDVHSQLGQEQIKDFLKYLIVYRATEINKGVEKAVQSVKEMNVAFT